MALPVALLKAKGMVTKATKAAKTSKQAKDIKNSLSQNETQDNTKKIIIGVISVGAVLFVIFLCLVISIISYPLIIVQSWFGGGTANASENVNFSDWDELYFNQSNGDWATVPYDATGGTIAQAGCGLVSITHVIDLLTGNTYTPDQISEQLKEYFNNNVSTYAPGGSVVAKLVEFAVGKYNLKSTHYDNIDDAIADMNSGNKVMICSDNGNSPFLTATGGTYYANHVIMAYKTDGNNVWVKDSGTANGNSIKYTKEQIAGIDYVGWFVLSK